MTSRFALLASLALGLLAGCSSSSSPSEGSDQPAEAKSSLDRDTAPSQVDVPTLAADNGTFAVAAYKELAKTDGNVFFSPYSISSALAMASAGAKGQTATDIATALHFSLPQEKLHPAFDAIDLALNKSVPPVTGQDGKPEVPFELHVTNSMWGYTGDTFQKPFLDTLAVSYGAGVYQEDFARDPAAAENTINGWVSDQTKGNIPHLLDGAIDAETRLVLVNAVYFQAQWDTPFEPALTKAAAFQAESGAVTVPTMHGGFEGSAINADGYDAVELRYKLNGSSSTVMDVVMPTAGTLAAFESSLTAGSLATIVTGLESGDVAVSMPKFGYHGKAVDLKALLQSLGMNAPFDPATADFSAATTTEPLYVSKVLHQATLEVDEQGTVATAATAVVESGSAAATKTITVSLDHPFLFFIRDPQTNTILFAGRITDPTK